MGIAKGLLDGDEVQKHVSLRDVPNLSFDFWAKGL